METIAGHTRDTTIVETQEFARHTTCFDHNMVGGAVVG